MQTQVDILLVEDDAEDSTLTLFALLEHQLTSKFYVARDGQEALDYVFCTGHYADRKITDQPRLILLDLNMRAIGGLEVLRRIRADPQTRAIPIVMLTASDEERDLIESYRLGVNSYILKPVDFKQFKEAARLVAKYWLLLNRTPSRAA
jgi:CheY-like chemotaxis protein